MSKTPPKSKKTWYIDKKSLSKAERKFVKQLLRQLGPTAGEERAIYRCVHCQQLIGRKFIPYGLGQGITLNPCMDVTTSNNTPLSKIVECDP
jgi:hypothetical protein